jgi:AcrR family transcriptional regulator
VLPIGAQIRSIDRGVARRQAFLQAAREVFLEYGYEAASVNEVVRRAGGSLATLYTQFGNKEGLFFAVAQDQFDRFVTEMAPPHCVEGLPLEQALQTIGEHFVRAMLLRDNVAFFRLVVGEGRKFPELLQRYVTEAGDRVRVELARHVERAGIADAEASTSYFIELLRGRHQYRALSDSNYQLCDDELEQHVRAAVRFFMNGLKLT